MQESVSLYIDLEEGTRADLEVVARAAIAYSAAIKELSYVLDPSIEIRVELASGTEGSLSLNSIIRTLQDKTDPLTLRVIAFTIILWFAADVRSYGLGKLIDHLVARPPAQELSQEDVQRIAEAILKALDDGVAKERVRDVYREVERDQSIRGIGASREPGARPDSIVPRSQFRERAGLGEVVETAPNRRTRTSIEHVRLVSPVLLASSRRWRFSFHEGEFGASIKDQGFLDDVLSGRLLIPMSAGINMDVLLETKEEFRDGVWVVQDRNIQQVFRIHPILRQSQLDLSPADPQEPDNH